MSRGSPLWNHFEAAGESDQTGRPEGPEQKQRLARSVSAARQTKRTGRTSVLSAVASTGVGGGSLSQGGRGGGEGSMRAPTPMDARSRRKRHVGWLVAGGLGEPGS